jgi:hypothetical protein
VLTSFKIDLAHNVILDVPCKTKWSSVKNPEMPERWEQLREFVQFGLPDSAA